jgi:hypothetical protein
VIPAAAAVDVGIHVVLFVRAADRDHIPNLRQRTARLLERQRQLLDFLSLDVWLLPWQKRIPLLQWLRQRNHL